MQISKTTRNKVKALKDFIREPYAWPGGYAKVLYMNDGEPVCKECAKENYKLILRATRDCDRSGWNVEAVDIHWEGASMICANCNKELPSEYGEPDEEENDGQKE